MMIQAIRKNPNCTPSAHDEAISVAGMPKTTQARTIAAIIPAIAATHTRARSARSTKNSVSTGTAATSVERGQEFRGS